MEGRSDLHSSNSPAAMKLPAIHFNATAVLLLFFCNNATSLTCRVFVFDNKLYQDKMLD